MEAGNENAAPADPVAAWTWQYAYNVQAAPMLQKSGEGLTYQQPLLPPQPGQERFYRREDNWPPRHYHKSLGEGIFIAQETPGNVRNDITIERRVIGRLLGKGGRDLQATKEYSGAELFIIDKHPPPGEGDDHRLLIIVGTPEQVELAREKVDATLDRAKRELAPLPPPLSSGWRPLPSVGNADDGPEWVHSEEYKKSDGSAMPMQNAAAARAAFEAVRDAPERGGGGGGYSEIGPAAPPEGRELRSELQQQYGGGGGGAPIGPPPGPRGGGDGDPYGAPPQQQYGLAPISSGGGGGDRYDDRGRDRDRRDDYDRRDRRDDYDRRDRRDDYDRRDRDRDRDRRYDDYDRGLDRDRDRRPRYDEYDRRR